MSMTQEGSQGHMGWTIKLASHRGCLGAFVQLLVSGQDLSVLLCFAQWSVLSAPVPTKGSDSCQTKGEKCPWGQKDPCMEPYFWRLCARHRDQGLGDQTVGCVFMGTRSREAQGGCVPGLSPRRIWFRDDIGSVGKDLMKA